MRVRMDRDEWFPVYQPWPALKRSPTTVDIPLALYKRWVRFEEEHEALQRELEPYYEEMCEKEAHLRK